MDKISDLSKDELLELLSQAFHSKTLHAREENFFSNDNSTTTINVQTNSHHNRVDEIQDHSDTNLPNDTIVVKQEPDDSIETIYIKNVTSPTNVPLTISSPVRIQKPFQIPTHTITEKLEDIQSMVHLLGNNDNNHSLQRFYSSLYTMIDDYNLDLLKRKDLMNADFVKSLETITKIFQITSKFSPIENINESVLTPTIRRMIMDYNSNIFKSLESYCTNNDASMFELNNDIEENLIRLIPVLSNQLLTFNKQLKKFYNLYEMVDDYSLTDPSFTDNLPTKDDMNLFNEINKATDIKVILQTNFNRINPYLIDQLNTEINNLSNYIELKISSLRDLIKNVVQVNNQLFKQNENGYISLPNFLQSNDMIQSKLGISSKTFTEYEDKLNEMTQLKDQREEILDDYMRKTEQLWSILRPNSTEIQAFLQKNHNLYLESLTNFKNLLKELEVEKLRNIKTFILSSREKIKGFWKVLMYDEESKQNFTDFFVNDVDQFDEDLLTSHSNELERLRNESESIKPLLLLISQLDDLIAEKLDLDKSLKDPSRLLKRNSFQILRQEERTQKKLQKQFPEVIAEIRLQIEEFQVSHNRTFKLNGNPYLQKLEEIESTFLFSKRKNFRSTPSSVNASASNKRKINAKVPKSKMTPKHNFATPSRSIIRKLNPDQMTNPFLSHEPTPKKLNQKTPTSVLSSKYNFSSPNSLVLNKTSPMRLNLNALTKITNLSSSGMRRKPMGVLSSTFNNSDNISYRTSPIKLSSNTLKSHYSPHVEELSDSMLDYSDDEGSKKDKENIEISSNELYKAKDFPSLTTTIQTNKQVQPTQQFNLSLDSETF